MTDELKEKTNRYIEMFNDVIPVMQLKGLSNKELISLIDNALETGEKIDTKFNFEDHYS